MDTIDKTISYSSYSSDSDNDSYDIEDDDDYTNSPESITSFLDFDTMEIASIIANKTNIFESLIIKYCADDVISVCKKFTYHGYREILADRTSYPKKMGEIHVVIRLACIRNDILLIHALLANPFYHEFFIDGIKFNPQDAFLIRASHFEKETMLPVVMAAAYGNVNIVDNILAHQVSEIIFSNTETRFYKHSMNYTLRYLIEGDFKKLIEMIIDRGYDIDETAPLYTAIEKKDNHLLDILLSTIAPPNKFLLKKCLLYAATNNILECAITILNHMNITDYGYQILSELVTSDNYCGIVKLILTDKRFSVMHNSSKLISLAIQNRAGEMVDIICDNEDLAYDINLRHVISQCISNGNIDIFYKLLNKHYVEPSSGGNIALEEACKAKNLKVAITLLRDPRFIPGGRTGTVIRKVLNNGWVDVLVILFRMIKIEFHEYKQAVLQSVNMGLCSTLSSLLNLKSRIICSEEEKPSFELDFDQLLLDLVFNAAKLEYIDILEVLLSHSESIKVHEYNNLLLAISMLDSKNLTKLFNVLMQRDSVKSGCIHPYIMIYSFKNNIDLPKDVIEKIPNINKWTIMTYLGIWNIDYNDVIERFCIIKGIVLKEEYVDEEFVLTETNKIKSWIRLYSDTNLLQKEYYKELVSEGIIVNEDNHMFILQNSYFD
jgi:hypothetical protein